MSKPDYKIEPRFNGGHGGATIKLDLNGRLFQRRELVKLALQLLSAAVAPGTLDPTLVEAVQQIGAVPERATLPVTIETGSVDDDDDSNENRCSECQGKITNKDDHRACADAREAWIDAHTPTERQ